MSWPWDRVPPWAASLLKQPLSEMADRLRKPEFVADVKQRLDQVIADLPNVAARKVDQVVRTAKRATDSVQRWAADRNAPAVKIVNASGVLFPDRADGAPVCAEVAIAWSATANAWSEHSTDTLTRAQRACQLRAHALANISIRVAATWPSAVVAATYCGAAPLLIPRWAAKPLGAAGPLPDVLRASGRELQEFGAVQSTPGPLSLEGNNLTVGTIVVWSDGTRESLAALKQPSLADVTKIVLAPHVWPNNPQLPDLVEPITLSQLFEAGADVVVVPGNGLWGGPGCGLLFASEERLSELDRVLYWRSIRADAATCAAVSAVLELWTDGTATQRLPVVAALACSLENLRYRASQLTTRLATVDGLAVTILDGQTSVWPEGPRVPTVKLRVERAGHAGVSWAESLAQGIPAIWAAADESGLLLDLRTVDPAMEATLCELLGGH